MIDWERIRELRREIGDDGVQEVTSSFREEAEETLEELAGMQDRAARAERLHFLRGGALNLGFTEMARLCAGAEKAPGATCPDDIARAFEAARRELARALSADA